MSQALNADTPTPRSGLGPALLWACFLGCSWTWVIGMFLPTLLLRDFGLAGWVAFAVPNIVGAAAMGFVLKNAAVSRAMTQKHATACRWFSGITIAFHLYVGLWLVNAWWLALVWVLPWLVLDAERRRRIGGWLPGLGVAVALLSWGAFSYATKLEGAWLDVAWAGAAGDVLPQRLERWELWLLAPGYLIGFALCPYLDLTFHRGRQATGPGTGKVAFALGFGLVFGSMIVFSLCYAGLMRPVLDGEGVGALPGVWQALLAIHIGVQVTYTLLLHSRERFAVAQKKDRWPLIWFALVLAGALVWATIARVSDASWSGISLGEVGYRSFLVLYGAALPGYVLLCILPTLRPKTDATKRRVYIMAAVLAIPCLFIAFALGHTIWMIAVFAVFGIARGSLDFLSGKRENEVATP